MVPSYPFLAFLLLLLTLVQTGSGNEYDGTGRGVSFYPNAMMLATNPKAMVFLRDTKLVRARKSRGTLNSVLYLARRSRIKVGGMLRSNRRSSPNRSLPQLHYYYFRLF